MPEEYDKDLGYVHRHMDEVIENVNEHTVVHADIDWKYFSQVIVVGRYKKNDYVRVFSIPEQTSFEDIVNILHKMEKGARRGRFDMPDQVSISAVYPREKL